MKISKMSSTSTMNLQYMDFSELSKDNTLSFMDKKKSVSHYHLVSICLVICIKRLINVLKGDIILLYGNQSTKMTKYHYVIPHKYCCVVRCQ